MCMEDGVSEGAARWQGLGGCGMLRLLKFSEHGALWKGSWTEARRAGKTSRGLCKTKEHGSI